MTMIEKNLIIFKNSNVLIVDDDISLLEDLNIVLGFFFKKVFVTSDSEEAIEIFKKNSIDLIFSDYVMPKLDGYQLCKKIREMNNNIPLVIISNHSDREKLLKLIDLKLSGYILKPYEFNDILEVLKKVASSIENDELFKIFFNQNTYFNTKTKILHQDKSVIKLTKTEVLLIELFIKNPNQLITSESIDFAISPHKPLSYQAGKNLIYRLRKKIGENSIESVQSLGYIFHK